MVKLLHLQKLSPSKGAGLVGALIYTFSDTFWFSAVEGEVYAYSSAFTAVVFWLILKWEDNADKPHSDRWLILITYMTGLSIGVHLLNLLCIPAIALVYYYKKVPEAKSKGIIISLSTLCGSCRSCTLWCCTWYYHRWRMVRTILHKHPWHAF